MPPRDSLSSGLSSENPQTRILIRKTCKLGTKERQMTGECSGNEQVLTNHSHAFVVGKRHVTSLIAGSKIKTVDGVISKDTF